MTMDDPPLPISTKPPPPPTPPSISGWAPSPESQSSQLSLYHPPRNDFALAAFNTPQSLDRLVQALAQHDLEEAFRSLRVRAIPLDYRALGFGLDAMELTQLPRRASGGETITSHAREMTPTEPTAQIIRLDDTDSDGTATEVVKKKKKPRKKRKDKNLISQEATNRSDGSQEVEGVEANLIVAEEGWSSASSGSTTPPAPKNPLPDVQVPEIRVEEVVSTDEEGSYIPPEPHNQFVGSSYSSTMALTPPPSPPSGSAAVPIDSVIEDLPPIRLPESGLPTPPLSAAIPDAPLIKILYPSPTQSWDSGITAASNHPLDKSWTLYFSDTSEKLRQARKTASPVATAEQYSTGLFTLFNASDLEDLIGGWKALRRRIATSKNRIIEPL